MSTPRSRSHSRRASRRSTTNLNHLTLAPLTTTQPLVINDDAAADTSYPRTSYIEDRSAPTTPSILSRSGSRKQLAPKSNPNLKSLGLGGYGDSKFSGPGFTAIDGGYAYAAEQLGLVTGSQQDRRTVGMTKAKSSIALSPPATTPLAVGDSDERKRRHHQRRSTGGSVRGVGAKGNEDSWLQRVGTVIASETRDAKGQSWLVSRQSSTSLVDQHSSEEEVHPSTVSMSARGSRAQLDWETERGTQTPRFSRLTSRNTSRAASRRQSRQGSRVELRTPTGLRTPIRGLTAGGYFGDVDMGEGTDEPDFVDPSEHLQVEKQDEDEVARLTQERDSGLGSWVDKFIGFSLFNVEEDREESADEAVEGESAEEARRRRLAEMTRRKEEKEQLIAKQQASEGGGPVQVERPKDEQGGWQDAAWLLSVASKILI